MFLFPHNFYMDTANTRYIIPRRFTYAAHTFTTELLSTATSADVLSELKKAVSDHYLLGVVLIDLQSQLFQIIGDNRAFDDLIREKCAGFNNRIIFDPQELIQA